MANKIRVSAEGLALQVTKPARRAGLVDEGPDRDAKKARKSDVYVYGFDDLLLVVDKDRVSASDRAQLVAEAASTTDSIHQGTTATVTVSGDPGYKVQLPGCNAAGFYEGVRPQVSAGDGILVIHEGQRRLAQVLTSQRQTQTDGGQDVDGTDG